MTVEPRRREIKRIVARTFLGFRASTQAVFDLKETAFIDSGRCMACCFRVEDLKAVWCVEDGIVNFYDAEGRLLRRINLLEEAVPQLMAA